MTNTHICIETRFAKFSSVPHSKAIICSTSTRSRKYEQTIRYTTCILDSRPENCDFFGFRASSTMSAALAPNMDLRYTQRYPFQNVTVSLAFSPLSTQIVPVSPRTVLWTTIPLFHSFKASSTRSFAQCSISNSHSRIWNVSGLEALVSNLACLIYRG